MDGNSENSNDSIEIGYLADIQPLGGGIPTEATVSDPNGILNGALPSLPLDSHINQPRAIIVEQPQQRGFRFRYECEGPSHGGLQGVNSERGRKTYPAIRIENYDGPVRIQVSLVTDSNPPKIHAHKLVGKNCSDGVCKVDFNSTANEISFQNLCVLHVTKKKAAEVLMNRILEDVKLQKQMCGSMATTSADENMKAKTSAKEQAQKLALNVVKLQFRVFLLNNEKQMISMLTPVVSQSIYDSKSPGASTLKICRMDKYGGCCTGNEEVFLLCEKVQKEDIAVRFVEHNTDGSVKWEAYGNFSPLDVHRQYAIVFKTPAYYDANIDKAVNVMIMLQRKSDCDVSEAKAFTYYPQNKDKDLIARKKRKKLPLDTSFHYYGGDEGPPGPDGGLGGGGFGGLGGGGGGSVNGGAGGGNGEGGQGTYSVIMPNGNIVDHMNVLPTTVEQVVKEEFDRCKLESPESVTTQASSPSPMSSPYDPMLWNGDINNINDLETDAASSLRHHPAVTVATPSRVAMTKQHLHDITSAGVSKEKSSSVLTPTHLQQDDITKSLPTPITNLRGQDHSSTKTGVHLVCCSTPVQEKTPLEEKKFTRTGDKGSSATTVSVDKGCSDLDPVKSSLTSPLNRQEMEPPIKFSVSTDRQKKVMNDKGDSTRSVQETTSEPENLTVPAEEILGRRGEQGDSVHSPTKLSEISVWSEGRRTDEGFSEASEDTSVRYETPVGEKCNSGKAETPKLDCKEKSNKEGGEKISRRQVKTATQVVKRVMEKITARTVRALQDFAETGDVRYLLIVQRHLTTYKNENGDLPIHLAVINNQTTSLCHLLDVMTSLPNARRSVNAFNYVRQTALHVAGIMHQPVHIELLLHAGADPSLADRNGNTPAHLAILNGSVEALKALIKYLRPGVTARNPFPELNYLNYDGYSPVHLAAQSGNVSILRLLVHGRANVDLADGKSGRTALHHAVEQDDLPVAGFLLMEANSDVNARCFDGNTPLHIACCRGLMGMVALLMTAGARTDIENEEIPPGERSDEEGEGEVAEEEMGVEEEEEGGPSLTCRRGLLPCDYAAGKDRLRIMSMLKGDGYLSDGEEGHQSMDEDDDDDLEEDTAPLVTYKSTCDSGVAVSLMLHSDHSGPSLSSDNSKLSADVRTELCQLLDPVHAGKDVYALAEQLGYNDLVAALEVMDCSGSSPTQYLLDYHETYGTVSKLKECLRSMHCEDAVRLMERHTTGDDNFLRMKASIASSRGRPPKLQQAIIAGADNGLLNHAEDGHMSDSSSEGAQHQPGPDTLSAQSFDALKIGDMVAVYYDDDYHIGSIHELKDSNTATINFMKKCVLSNNTYVWPQPRLYDDISWCYIFEADFQIDTRNGRIWNVPIDTNLDLKYQMYKKKYCV